MHRPELVRSWASDVVGVFDPDYVWHDLAQVWQTPGEGEQLVETFLGGTVEDRAAQYATGGMPMDIGTSIAAAQGPEMGRAILLLYRSARQPAMAQAGRALEKAAVRPGLSLLATEDSYVGSAEIRRRAADRAGARTEVLDGLGHWWMVQDPAHGAAVLTHFWDGLDWSSAYRDLGIGLCASWLRLCRAGWISRRPQNQQSSMAPPLGAVHGHYPSDRRVSPCIVFSKRALNVAEDTRQVVDFVPNRFGPIYSGSRRPKLEV